MSEASYARVAGHGVALVPRTPFAIGRDGDFVFVQHGDRAARIRVADGSLRYVLVGADALADVAHAVETAYTGPFRIETSAFSCAWPAGTAIVSVDRPGPFLFDVVPAPTEGERGDRGDDAAFVFVVGPYSLALCPSVDSLRAEGHEEVERAELEDRQVMEVAYEHAGARYRKRHLRFVTQAEDAEAARAFVFTAQGPEREFDAMRAALDEMAATLEHD